VLRIGLQTALGLAAAHAQGLVHRDVKPSNILLENGVERVKLTDFGLARAVDDGSLTQSGVVAGTPQYMSPEQAGGEPIDHRSDLFSLGSVLYFMCAGYPPFRASSTPAILRRVCDQEPRPIREVNPDVPEWLAGVIKRLHAKNPSVRFQSAAEVADVLGRYLADFQRGLAIIGQASAAPKPARRPINRKTALLALAVPAAVIAFTLVAKSDRKAEDGPPALGLAQAGSTGRVYYISEDAVVQLPEQSRPDELIVGSGKPASQSWDIADFTKVQVRSTFQAEITKGPRFKVTTTADDNILDKVQVTKDGSTLKISLAKGNYSTKTSFKAEITMPALAGLSVGGASTGTIKGFESEKEIAINVSGASSVDGGIGAELVNAEVDGASSLTLSGTGQSGRLAAHGASNLKLAEFLFKQAEVQLIGASNAVLKVQSVAPFKALLEDASELSGSIDATSFNLELSGASTAKLRGRTHDAKFSAEGASTLALADLGTDNVVVTLHGASTAEVNVKSTLEYDLSSASNLTYRGEPKSLKGRKSGGSSVSKQH
jgi:eukaryotic-like serine/threonine-protein kinase